MSSLAAEATRVKSAAILGIALALLAAIVLLGRWEGTRHAEAEVRGMSETLALIGPLDSTALSGYRVLPEFDCLVYRRGDNPYALEVCVEADGRVVETIDRREFDRRIHSLREDPTASTLLVDRALVDRLLRRMGAPNG